MKQELGSLLIQDLNNDSVVLGKNWSVRWIRLFCLQIDIMTKWSHLQTIANEKDDQLNQNRQQWKDFKRQLDNLEQAAQQFTNIDNFCQWKNLWKWKFTSVFV